MFISIALLQSGLIATRFNFIFIFVVVFVVVFVVANIDRHFCDGFDFLSLDVEFKYLMGVDVSRDYYVGLSPQARVNYRHYAVVILGRDFLD